MKKIVNIKNLAALEKFAAAYAKTLRPGDIIGLVGDLGAGKTTFVQTLSKVLGVKVPVRSPTFILMQVLPTSKAVAKRTHIANLCHIDAYRLNNEDELFAIGFGEYAERDDSVILVEWADRLPSVQWLDHYREIKFDFDGEGERVLTLNGAANRPKRLID